MNRSYVNNSSILLIFNFGYHHVVYDNNDNILINGFLFTEYINVAQWYYSIDTHIIPQILGVIHKPIFQIRSKHLFWE